MRERNLSLMRNGMNVGFELSKSLQLQSAAWGESSILVNGIPQEFLAARLVLDGH